MLQLIKYEIKKHFKIILSLMLVALVIIVFENLGNKYAQNIQSDLTSIEAAKNLFTVFSFLFIRLFLFGLFIYFCDDFLKNISEGERHFFFSLPLETSKFILAKIISISFLTICLVLYIVLASGLFTDSFKSIDNLSFVVKNFFNDQLFGLVSLYSISLVALLLGYFSILTWKKLLIKTNYRYLWLFPFSIFFAIYFGILISVFNDAPFFMFIPKSWPFIGINAVVSLILYNLDVWKLDKKTDL